MLTQEQATTLERKIERFAQILAKNPGDGLTVLALAEASFRRGLKLEALTAYQTVTKEQPVPEAHLAVAEIYSQQNMTTEAYGELRKLFQLDPENVEARLLIRILERQSPPPDDIQTLLRTPASEEAFQEARLRLQIQRAIHNRELQERTRNGTLEPGIVIHEYYIEEAKKKLIEVDEQVRKLDDLKAFNETLADLPVPEPVSAQAEVVEEPDIGFALEQELASAMEDFEQQDPGQAPVVDYVPVPEAEEFAAPVPPSPLEIGEAEAAPSLALEPEIELEPESVTPTYDQSQELDIVPELLIHAEPVLVPEEEIASQEEGFVDFAAPLTNEEASPDLVLLRDPEVNPAPPEPDPVAPTESSEMDFPPVPPPADEFDVPELVDDLSPYPEPIVDSAPVTPIEDIQLEEASIETASIEESSIDLSIPLEVSGVLDPELPDFDEAEPATLPVTPVQPMPEPRLNDAMTEPGSGTRSGFGAPPAIEPITFGEPEAAGEPEPVPVAVVLEVADDPILPDVPEPVPTAPEAVVEVVPVAVVEEVTEAPVSPGMSAAARQAYYESKAEEIGKLTGTLARTRGVSSIFLVARDGTTIDSVVKDDITEARVGELVKESFEFLSAYADSPAYWVLECAGGIFVMQTLDSEHVLIAIGQAGANFGALRYTMDKTKAKFETILQNVPR